MILIFLSCREMAHKEFGRQIQNLVVNHELRPVHTLAEGGHTS